MARVAGIDLPNNKRLDIALRYIYGIGPAISDEIIKELSLNPAKRVKDLTEEEVGRINNLITKNLKVEGDLRREVQSNIKRLIEIRSYRGLRHRRNLPVRGQRTKTNARTRRGKRKTVGAGKSTSSIKRVK
ncbi:30S ribosomal protein S13 [Endomicrobiia bacterium]|uniref:Small ribosomal subunit protein uS13 n=1 Tax=Endomicrobium trichonymphae TaxID=1408204 RepID=RS13_ENDTX|nr:30S ribosomal protein S13 [Candidatus Endomicrobium trichonymphae]B1GZA7.1 RecName: Full=Small ribosomal subunit protein uS13; AltName: Full=30S ribosomal protein S13 [Candidatus Endomicrobium trichonymphae]GHT05207.1 30S ribosomal protein S13 [Endomicrobiia bacterium]BAG13589.1 30S ribosomal protein S13 [Candidatus Endomicrobium trichonymphae]BAV58671.1 30S ribosomal protein S13 [Candidatus Endomicrobium trichonymphae]GHT10174.1 30S ribosomal protein S13 [Endomicrobiia bacterium]GHT14396.